MSRRRKEESCHDPSSPAQHHQHSIWPPFSSHNSPFADHETQNHGGRLEEAQAFHSPSRMGMLNYLVAGTSVWVSNKLWIQHLIHHHILATLPRGYVSLIKSVLIVTHCHQLSNILNHWLPCWILILLRACQTFRPPRPKKLIDLIGETESYRGLLPK